MYPAYWGFIVVALHLFHFGSSNPTGPGPNSQPQPVHRQGVSDFPYNANSNTAVAASDLNNNSEGQFEYRGGHQPTYVQNFQSGYRDQSQQSSPFMGLSTTGEFRLSAYFSQIFWGVVAVVIAVAVVIWLIRIVLPNESVDTFVQKFKSSKTGKSLDLDGLTSMVYSALDSYSKWTGLSTGNDLARHPKRS